MGGCAERHGPGMKIVHIVGARPNFMKASSVTRALGKYKSIDQEVIHTGQHYSAEINEAILSDLDFPHISANLNVGSGPHGRQTAKVIEGVESHLLRDKPDMVIIYGDTNSTLGAAIACSKAGIRLAHVEAGARSYDRTMPEELNRIIVDHLSDILFAVHREDTLALQREGINGERIHLVGNTMIDSLQFHLPRALRKYKPALDDFGLMTLHRPSNVDNPDRFGAIVDAIVNVSRLIPLVFPIHPRTREALKGDRGISERLKGGNIMAVDPMGYLEFLAHEAAARFVITDSGSMQEETAFLGVSCLTLRRNTESRISVEIGTNTLVYDPKNLTAHATAILSGGGRRAERTPDLWDGRAGDRIAEVIVARRDGIIGNPDAQWYYNTPPKGIGK